MCDIHFVNTIKCGVLGLTRLDILVTYAYICYCLKHLALASLRTILVFHKGLVDVVAIAISLDM